MNCDGPFLIPAVPWFGWAVLGFALWADMFVWGLGLVLFGDGDGGGRWGGWKDMERWKGGMSGKMVYLRYVGNIDIQFLSKCLV